MKNIKNSTSQGDMAELHRKADEALTVLRALDGMAVSNAKAQRTLTDKSNEILREIRARAIEMAKLLRELFTRPGKAK